MVLVQSKNTSNHTIPTFLKFMSLVELKAQASNMADYAKAAIANIVVWASSGSASVSTELTFKIVFGVLNGIVALLTIFWLIQKIRNSSLEKEEKKLSIQLKKLELEKTKPVKTKKAL